MPRHGVNDGIMHELIRNRIGLILTVIDGQSNFKVWTCEEGQMKQHSS
jgi:hypothetical protein